MSFLGFFFFGVMDICYGQQSLEKPATLKSQSLLAYMVMHQGTPQTRERLAELFWGDWPSDKARRNLSTALWRVRRCFPVEVFSTDAHSVCFNFPEDYSFDIQTFEVLIEKDDVASLEEAIGLYRGEFLEGFYDDWVINTRYRLEAAYFDALARLMGLQAKGGKYQTCLNTALRLIELDPLREDAHRYAMRSFACLGQSSKALAQYNHCRQVLKNELGIEPTTETSDLYQDILAGRVVVSEGVDKSAVEVAPSKEAGIPPSPLAGRDPWGVFTLSRLVGRETEMDFLEQCWGRTRDGKGRFLLVSGEAGVGKSRLVSEFSQKLRASGVSTSIGRCYEFEGTLPYQPIAEAIRSSLQSQRTDLLRDMPLGRCWDYLTWYQRLRNNLPRGNHSSRVRGNKARRAYSKACCPF